MINDQQASTSAPPSPPADAAGLAGLGELSQAAGPGGGTPDGLTSALAAACELIAGTADVINPGTPPRKLLDFAAQYRRCLVNLVAACAPAASGDSA